MYVCHVCSHTGVHTCMSCRSREQLLALLRLCRRPEEKGGKLIGKCDKMKFFREKFAHTRQTEHSRDTSQHLYKALDLHGVLQHFHYWEKKVEEQCEEQCQKAVRSSKKNVNLRFRRSKGRRRRVNATQKYLEFFFNVNR